MEHVDNSATQYHDVVSRAAKKDFSDIIAYCMNDGLRKTFIQAHRKPIPTDSEIYKRHAENLYRHRYPLTFPSIQKYRNDQAQSDYTVIIHSGTEY